MTTNRITANRPSRTITVATPLIPEGITLTIPQALNAASRIPSDDTPENRAYAAELIRAVEELLGRTLTWQDWVTPLHLTY